MFKEVRTLLCWHGWSKNISISTYCQYQRDSRSFKQEFKLLANWTDTDIKTIPILGGKRFQCMLKIQGEGSESASFCVCSGVHSQDMLSEPAEAPLPRCVSGSAGGTGSTTMSKSDTFQGPEGFRTPSAPGRVDPPTPYQGKKTQGWKSTDIG